VGVGVGVNGRDRERERDAIERLRRGDIDGLEVLVRRYQLQAVRAAVLITRDRALAEDIVQSAFLRAYQRIDQFDASRPFAPWFLRSVVNDAVKAAQRSGRQVPLSDADSAILDRAGADLDPEALVERLDAARSIRAAIDLLSPEQRAAVVLRYYLELSDAETAERLAAPVGTIKWRLHAARSRLRQLLRADDLETMKRGPDE
jgi:RNA polymerase sigma-70 factor (ECF subfamily)